tara:strand:+ start:511 stop:747 length:237 start_codon:yes stop_codon:yes gene_type:complete
MEVTQLAVITAQQEAMVYLQASVVVPLLVVVVVAVHHTLALAQRKATLEVLEAVVHQVGTMSHLPQGVGIMVVVVVAV